MRDTTTITNLCSPPVLEQKTLQRVLLVASAPPGLLAADRVSIPLFLSAGRSSSSNLTIKDKQLSKEHFRLTKVGKKTYIEDLKSTNGTFVNGRKLQFKQVLEHNSIIRAGQIILVYVENNGLLTDPPAHQNYGIAGRFHTNSLIKELREAAISNRSILLAGPSGSGKELAAGALTSMINQETANSPYVAHNAGLFATEDEATSTLFGVGPKVFSGVDARSGLIDQANGGTLFLDEINNLPYRVQQSLLRVIEDGKTKRIGQTQTRDAQVRFVFASNKDDPTSGLAPDLFARLRVVRIPPLKERPADVPSVFNTVLTSTCAVQGVDSSKLIPLLTGNHYEALCLDGFVGTNVRGLIDIADRLVTRVSTGATAPEAVLSTFSEFFEKGLIAGRTDDEEQTPAPEMKGQNKTNSRYEYNKKTIIAVYHQQEGNISATKRVLGENGISCNRRWLTHFLELWGVR